MSKTVVKIEKTEADTQVGTKQLTIFLQGHLIELAKGEAERLSTVTGLRVLYTAVLRMALARGMPLVMEDGAATGGSGSRASGDGEDPMEQVTLFLPVDSIDEAKKESRRLSVNGLRVSYLSVVRVAMARGMAIVVKEGKKGSGGKR
jgi:hypothetical protein